MPDENILEEANRLTKRTGDRRNDYGSPHREAEAIAGACDALGLRADRPDHWHAIMLILKIQRQLTRPKRDNLVDIAGYAAVWATYDAEEEELRGWENDGKVPIDRNNMEWILQGPTYGLEEGEKVTVVPKQEYQLPRSGEHTNDYE